MKTVIDDAKKPVVDLVQEQELCGKKGRPIFKTQER